MSNKKLVLLFAAFALVYLSTVGTYRLVFMSDPILWDVIDLSGNEGTGDAHLLRFPDGHTVLIDTGSRRQASSELMLYLHKSGVSHLHQLIISHAHSDNYGGIPVLLENAIKIDEILFYLPDPDVCNADQVDGGCQWEELDVMIGAMKRLRQELHFMAIGDVLYHDPEREISLVVLYTHDGISPPIGRTSINDTSLVAMLHYGRQRALFTGDLGEHASDWLLSRSVNVQANLVTVPRHGMGEDKNHRFLNAVDAETAIATASEAVWQSDAVESTRDYFSDRDIPVFVNGIHGHLQISLRPRDFEVRGGYAPPAFSEGTF